MRSRRNQCASIFAGLAASLVTQYALAERVPIGGRTATMGGAAVAAGNDSAMPYLNPAGLAGVPGDIFGVSATAYGYQSLSVKNYFMPAGYAQRSYGAPVVQENSMHSSSYFDLPSSVMYFTRTGALAADAGYKVGIALVIPELERREMVGSFNARFPQANGTWAQTLGYAIRRTDHYFGPSAALNWGRLRLGVSAFAHYARSNVVSNSTWMLAINGGAFGGSNSTSQATTAEAFGFAPILGMQLRLVSNLWTGVAVGIPSIHLYGRRVYAGTADGVVPLSGIASSERRLESSGVNAYRQSTPLRASLGLAWNDRKSFSLAVDASYRASRSHATEYDTVSRITYARTGEVTRNYNRSASGIIAMDLEQRIDLSVGGELVINPLVALRAGAFTDFANTPEIANLGSDLYRLRLNHVGVSAGLGLTLSSFDTTFGIIYMHGTGKMAAMDNDSDVASQNGVQIVATEAIQNALYVVLSGTVTREEAKKQISDELALGPIPTLPENGDTGLKYERPPYGPAGLSSDKPRPMAVDVPTVDVTTSTPTTPQPIPATPAGAPATPAHDSTEVRP